MSTDFQNAKTPKELLELIESALHVQSMWDYLPNTSLDPSDQYELQQAAIRIRAQNLFLGLPEVPSSGNAVDFQNWCIDAQKIMDEAKKNGGANPNQIEPSKDVVQTCPKRTSRMTKDYKIGNIENDLLGANPDIIYKALCTLSNRPPMLMTQVIRYKLDMVSNAGNLKSSGKSIYEVIQQDIQSFQRRAIKEANNDDKLIQKIENYVHSLFDWLEGFEKKETLSNTKKIQLNIQRQTIIDELLEKKKN